MSLSIQIESCGPLETNAFLLRDDNSKNLVLIDSAIRSDALFLETQRLVQEGYRLQAIWCTHGHFDHVYDNARWKAAFEAPIYASPLDADFLQHLREQSLWFGLPSPEVVPFDFSLEEGQTLSIGEITAQVLSLPGHSLGSVGFYFPSEKALVGGDVLFAGSVGRTDLPGGSPATLATSLRRLFALPDETLVFPGHGPQSTIGDEKRSNPVARQLLAAYPEIQ